ncbi:MAG: hypothetical protein K2I28_04570, partial [Muribaculaceae bacterium]|nr:hypothetical protein [Muribaculaceae bacterium]
KLDGQGGGDTPVTPPATDGGTEDKPYSVADVLGLNNPGTTSWVEGYIIGSSNGVNGAFVPNLAATGNAGSNILLAVDPTETDPAKMVPVQLVAGTAIRQQLNLIDNPANLGKKVKIEGKLEKYFARPGIKSPSAFQLL